MGYIHNWNRAASLKHSVQTSPVWAVYTPVIRLIAHVSSSFQDRRCPVTIIYKILIQVMRICEIGQNSNAGLTSVTRPKKKSFLRKHCIEFVGGGAYACYEFRYSANSIYEASKKLVCAEALHYEVYKHVSKSMSARSIHFLAVRVGLCLRICRLVSCLSLHFFSACNNSTCTSSVVSTSKTLSHTTRRVAYLHVCTG